jgi:hypothetical protein
MSLFVFTHDDSPDRRRLVSTTSIIRASRPIRVRRRKSSVDDATHLFSPTRTHWVIAADEKCDVITRNGALLSVRK